MLSLEAVLEIPLIISTYLSYLVTILDRIVLPLSGVGYTLIDYAYHSLKYVILNVSHCEYINLSLESLYTSFLQVMFTFVLF